MFGSVNTLGTRDDVDEVDPEPLALVDRSLKENVKSASLCQMNNLVNSSTRL